MRMAATATRSRKRRPVTRRDRRSGRRRRVWIGRGARETTRVSRPLFFSASAQHVERARGADWLGALAMLLGVLSWGAVAALLGG